jgi:hypothetical protein
VFKLGSPSVCNVSNVLTFFVRWLKLIKAPRGAFFYLTLEGIVIDRPLMMGNVKTD